jgi:predicted DCC family thiol-disulfide oxidoreductase YuxK
MKTASKVLIYDNDCLLCKAYTGAFVKSGLLPASGRQHFNTVDPEIFKLVDQQLCNNEIPLVDVAEKKVWYGIDAMLEILGAKFPFIKRWGNLQPIKWILKKGYKIISYNRKVIVATAPPAGYDCSPNFHLRYRFLFLGILLGLHWMMLPVLYKMVFQQMETANLKLQHLAIMYVGLVFVSALSLVSTGIKKGMEAVGQIMMSITIGLLWLIPLLIITNVFGQLPSAFVYVYSGAVLVLIVKEANRRMKYWNSIKERL